MVVIINSMLRYLTTLELRRAVLPLAERQYPASAASETKTKGEPIFEDGLNKMMAAPGKEAGEHVEIICVSIGIRCCSWCARMSV